MFNKSRLKVIYRYIFRSSKNPESLARGVGLGLFIAFLPAVGFQIILALLSASALNANRFVTVLGTFVTNPFTALPISAFSLWLGNTIMPSPNLTFSQMKQFEWSEIFSSSSEIGLRFLLGSVILSFLSGVLGYCFMKIYFRIIQKPRRQ